MAGFNLPDHFDPPEVVGLQVEPPPPSAVGVNPGDTEAIPAGDDATSKPVEFSWPLFLQKAESEEIRLQFAKDVDGIITKHQLKNACCMAIFEPANSIDNVDLDRVYRSLLNENSNHSKDVILFLLSPGGAGDPAYQISKICKFFSKSCFKVIVPRIAKSAATLIAIGADEIHMSLLGQLGPIDPQIGGLPALGVSSALRTIASVSEQYPRSADMFARYLRSALTVEQIGYCDRVSESAVQYAERLLSTKPSLAPRALGIAKELVYEYKDHGFVIDLEEAQKHLGSDWIKTDTTELRAAEEIYELFENVNFWLSLVKSKRILITGSATSPNSVLIFDNKRS
jgi:Serine dehydrogenase proteinase